MRESLDRIRVLHVDDDPGFAELAATFLEREIDAFSVETATSADEGLRRLTDEDEEFDCVVSDYDMPGRNGLEFLDAVRERDSRLPFILFTGKGSEEVASDAISAGVTDYLQKEYGRDQYAILANRIENAVEARRAQRERQRQLDAIETAQEGISILDEDDYFVYVNEAYADLYGYEPSDIVGEHWTLLYREEDVEEMREEVLPEVRETGYWRGVTTGVRADGSTFVEDHILATSDRGELVCTVRDITESEERKERLRESMTKFEVLFESSPDMILTHDAEGDILDANERLAEKLGYEESELVGKRVWEIDRTVDPAEAAAFWEDLPADAIRKFEGAYRRRDGSTFPVEVHLVRLEIHGESQYLAISHDISDRRAREEELQRTNAVLSTLVETLPDGVLVEDDAREVIVTNQRLFDILSLPGSPEDAVGRDCRQLARRVDAQFVDAEGFLDRIDELVAEREGQATDELTLEDGRTLTRTYRPLELPDGEGHLWVYRDVTEQKTREKRLEEFASVVSHDLRNPLNVAMGQLELVRKGSDSDHLDAVADAHDRMATLIEDLLTLAHEGKAVTDVEPVALADVVEDSWSNVETPAAALSVEATGEIRADRGRLQQLLENLFRNAVEHGSTSNRNTHPSDDAVEHGSTSNRNTHPSDDAVEHGSTSNRSDGDGPDAEAGAAIEVTVGRVDGGFFVEDDGVGIPAAERERIFEAGYSCDESGTGFGLSIAREIADAHGWSIRATGGDDGGARFEIRDVDWVA